MDKDGKVHGKKADKMKLKLPIPSDESVSDPLKVKTPQKPLKEKKRTPKFGKAKI
jgi:hypothetical protein